MQLAGNVEPEREAEDLAVAEPSSKLVGRVALENPEMLFQHLSKRPEGDPFSVRQAAAGSPQRLGVVGGEAPPELAHQPRLADAGVPEQRDEHRSPAVHAAPVGARKPPELGLAA